MYKALIFVVALIATHVSAYKYLGVLHTRARSHFIVGSALMRGLAEQGHEVYVIAPFELKNAPANYHHIPTPTIMNAMADDIANLLDTLERSVVQNVLDFHEMGLRITQAVLDEKEVQDLLKSNHTFDAVICEVFLSEALYGISEHFKAPLIGLGTFGAIAWNTDMVGSPSPPSYVPNALLRFTDRMTLTERVGNLAFTAFERLMLDLWYLPRQQALYKQYFPHLKRPLLEVRKNAALVLLNSHVSISFARPYVPNQIEVAGMHITGKTKPLPENIRKFIEEAKHGVIYFSMGSNLKSKSLPLEKRAILLNTLRGLKQRVLWKFEEPNLPGKPDNVLISDWFPQDDILAHPNVKLFITHGGLLSSTESIYFGKPIVGIPIFGDQFLNMARAEANGYGIRVDYQTITEENFKAAIERILNDTKYTKLVKEMSARYRDQDMLPLKRAIYWVEHVARHKGAKYLHCAGQDLSFIQYHNIDAILILIGILLSIVISFYLLLKFLARIIYNLFANNNATKKQKKN